MLPFVRVFRLHCFLRMVILQLPPTPFPFPFYVLEAPAADAWLPATGGVFSIANYTGSLSLYLSRSFASALAKVEALSKKRLDLPWNVSKVGPLTATPSHFTTNHLT
eukprot:TRINITY_DN5401_c0_g1_i3.p1 TRINITY_DN5401_c0_g1~~TRINITY_DN5401_c0_g1_i3.p1  ORF type:complete len:107 (+),score=7.20 TRINITY_DN5401_c0_g1_i3:426-746(+)